MATSNETIILAKQGNQEAIEQVIRENSKFVRVIARRFPDVDDAYQNGLIGLLDAIERFDVERGVTFLTFAKSRIWYAMVKPFRRRTDDKEMLHFGETIEDDEVGTINLSIPEDKLAHEIYRKKLMRENLFSAMEQLEEIEKRVLYLRFFEGMNLYEIGSEIGKSYQRVYQIQVKALDSMKHIMEK